MSQDSKSADGLQAVLVLVATIGMIAFYGLAAAGYVNDVMPAAIAAKYVTVVTPAAYASTIWSLIFLGMIAFSIYQLLPSKMTRFRNIRSLYILSCVLNCGWIFFWQREMMGACLVLIFALLGTLLLINVKLNMTETIRESVFTKAPFGIYFGWVTAAAIVNFVIFLMYIGAKLSPTGWNIFGSLLMVIAMVLALIVRVKLRNFLYPLAIAWALTGIAVRQSGNTMVILVAAICVVVCLVLSISFVMDLPSSSHE